MKTLKDFILESQNIVESFGSDIIRELVTNDRKKGDYWWLIKNELKWDKITDNDVEVMDPKQVLKQIKNDESDTIYCIWCDDNEVLGRTIGKSLNTLIAGVATIVGLMRKEDVTKAIIIKNWEQFETRDLQKARKEAKEGALALKSNEDILRDNQEKYKKLSAVLKASKLQKNADLDKIFDKVTSTLNQVLMSMKYNENLMRHDSWSITELDRIFRDYQDVMEMIWKLRNPSIWQKDAKETIKDFEDNGLNTKLGRFDYERVTDYIRNLEELYDRIEGFIERANIQIEKW